MRFSGLDGRWRSRASNGDSAADPVRQLSSSWSLGDRTPVSGRWLCPFRGPPICLPSRRVEGYLQGLRCSAVTGVLWCPDVNTEGPVCPDRHYCILPLARLDDMDGVLELGPRRNHSAGAIRGVFRMRLRTCAAVLGSVMRQSSGGSQALDELNAGGVMVPGYLLELEQPVVDSPRYRAEIRNCLSTGSRGQISNDLCSGWLARTSTWCTARGTGDTVKLRMVSTFMRV